MISSLIDFGKKKIMNKRMKTAAPKAETDGQATVMILTKVKIIGTNEKTIMTMR